MEWFSPEVVARVLTYEVMKTAVAAKKGKHSLFES